jgi:hypothetical protein
MATNDYFRPRGDITTILDLTDRDAQDNTYFPVNANATYFHRGTLENFDKKEEEKETINTVYPSVMTVQEFVQRGPADWGQKFTFEIGTLPAGDLLQSVTLQIKLNSWYNDAIINRLSKAEITTDLSAYANEYWTYANNLGATIIEYAEFIVNEQLIERVTGEFIRVITALDADSNSFFGISSDGYGTVPYSQLATESVEQTSYHPRRPFPVENGVYFCVIPFFFLRTKLKEIFPLVACNEGNVRIDVKLRPFHNMVRKYIGYRETCDDVPLNKVVSFVTPPMGVVTTTTTVCPPAFRDIRILTACSLISGTLREKFLHEPFEQMVKLVQTFHFDEPLKYVVSKPNPHSDVIDLQLPLECNHPVTELIWVFRRKAVEINNEWANFTPSISLELNPTRRYQPWLRSGTIRINGSEVISADGEWFRQHISSKHMGGYTSYQSHIYGYSFAEYPGEHQPSGTANMSRATSLMLRLTVNQPIVKNIDTLESPCSFDAVTVSGWEIFVFAIHYNWLRFENGICNRIFTD